MEREIRTQPDPNFYERRKLYRHLAIIEQAAVIQLGYDGAVSRELNKTADKIQARIDEIEAER